MKTSSSPEQRPRVMVTLGMDHWQFDRVLEWVDRWLDDGASERVSCLAQIGPSHEPKTAQWVRFLEYDALEQALAAATAVVCHAGPGSIMMARWKGHRPLVVPRRAELHEVVDNHQVTFARQLAAEGEIELAEDEATLRKLLDVAVDRGGPALRPGSGFEMTEPLARLERLVDDLVIGRPTVRHRWRRTGGSPGS